MDAIPVRIDLADDDDVAEVCDEIQTVLDLDGEVVDLSPTFRSVLLDVDQALATAQAARVAAAVRDLQVQRDEPDAPAAGGICAEV